MNGSTDHSSIIAALRADTGTISAVCADLLEMHDATAVSLDHWTDARQMIADRLEYIEGPAFDFQPNGA